MKKLKCKESSFLRLFNKEQASDPNFHLHFYLEVQLLFYLAVYFAINLTILLFLSTLFMHIV